MSERNEHTEFDDVYEDESLGAALAAQWQGAPWYVSSFGMHAVLFLVLLLFSPGPEAPTTPAMVMQTTISDPVVEEPPVPPKPPTPEIDPPEPEEMDIAPEVTVAVVTDIELTDPVEDPVEDPAKGDPSDFTDLNEAINSPALMGMGSLGGAGGPGGVVGVRRGREKGRVGHINGIDKNVKDRLQAALRWLAEHQEADGSWRNEKYEGAGKHDVAVTALALLAFLGDGNSATYGRYRENVKAAQAWLISKQNPTGFIGDWQGTKHLGEEPPEFQKKYTYDAAIALMAIVEAAGMEESDSTLQIAAQKAVDAACKAQLADGGWESTWGDNHGDVSVSGWYMMGLKSAKLGGLQVPTSVWDGAKRFFTVVATPAQEFGEDAYVGTYHPAGGVAADPTPVCTAAVMCCRQFLGYAQSDPIIQGCAESLLSEGALGSGKFKNRESFLPASRLGESQNFYLWYYESLGFLQLGPKSRAWKEFNPRMKKELSATQRSDGTYAEYRGSWDPNNSGGENAWGRVGQTAVGALMLEVYYRYGNTHDKKHML